MANFPIEKKIVSIKKRALIEDITLYRKQCRYLIGNELSLSLNSPSQLIC